MESMKTNTAEAAVPRHVVKNRRLAVIINVVLNLLYVSLYPFYVGIFTEILKRFELQTAEMIILFAVSPCFFVVLRILLFYATVYDDHIVATSANGDTASKIPLEKTSVLV